MTKISEAEEDTQNEGGSCLSEQIFLDEDGNLVKMEDFNLSQSYLVPEDNFWRLVYLRMA